MFFPYKRFSSHQIERLYQIAFASYLFHSRHGITHMVRSSRRTYTFLESGLSLERGLAILLSKAIYARTNSPEHTFIHKTGLKIPLLNCCVKLFKRLPNIIGFCYYPWLTPKMKSRQLLKKPCAPDIGHLVPELDLIWRPPLWEQNSKKQKVVCKLLKQGIN